MTTRPLGYHLKHLHNLLETHFVQTLSDLGTDRRQWQLLNTLVGGPRTVAGLGEALAPFWTAGEPTLSTTLADLTDRGWIATDADTVTLTQAGASVHADLADRVERSRAVVVRGLTEAQYAETTRILAVMADNVAADLDVRSRGAGETAPVA